MNTEPKTVTLRIANGTAKSEAVRLMDFVKAGGGQENKHFTPKGVIFPITTQTAFTFEVSEADTIDGAQPADGTFVQLRDLANVAIGVTKTAGGGSAHSLSAQTFTGWKWLRLVAGGNEGANRDIILKGFEV